MNKNEVQRITPDSPKAFFNIELSWLGFARRVLSLVEDRDLPLLERVKFAGIMGMLHDEFFMKRVGGLKRHILQKSTKTSNDGRLPQQTFDACRKKITNQMRILEDVINQDIRPAMERAGLPIYDYERLNKQQKAHMRRYFRESVQPILTPLAVDAEHPFPFVSSLGLNLAVILPDGTGGRERFVRVKVPKNRPRWVPLDRNRGFVPLEQVIAANFDLMCGGVSPLAVYCFRVTRGAESTREPDQSAGLREPGSIVRLVALDLKARRFAGVVRIQVESGMPEDLRVWLAEQFEVEMADVYPTASPLGISDFFGLDSIKGDALRYPPLVPATNSRLRDLDQQDPAAIFEEIKRGDILLHHPYQSFDNSVLRFLESAALDPTVLAIKITIYRTSEDSRIVAALAEAARRGKQVAVLVEITARFDEAPNIAWGEYLEKAGVHVSYGVDRLKTHIKLALVIREEKGDVRRYLHLGTGNYHTGTARIYEDLGVLTCNKDLCEDAGMVFNSLTGAISHHGYRRMLVAPINMRERFVELIRREAEHAAAGRPCGIRAKMNQLQDAAIVSELYLASQAGVPISLNVRGLCVLRPGITGLSENIRVFSVIGRYLEHSRIYAFTNGGDSEYFIGSADWMKRNLDRRMETVVPILDADVKLQLEQIINIYESDNCSAWDCRQGGKYVLRKPAEDAPRLAAQEQFIELEKTRCPSFSGNADPAEKPAQRRKTLPVPPGVNSRPAAPPGADAATRHSGIQRPARRDLPRSPPDVLES